jgi:hypothetical protein
LKAEPSLRDFPIFEKQPVGVSDGATHLPEVAQQRGDPEPVAQPIEGEPLDGTLKFRQQFVDFVGPYQNLDLQEPRRRTLRTDGEERVYCPPGLRQVADVPGVDQALNRRSDNRRTERSPEGDSRIRQLRIAPEIHDVS